MKKITRDKEKLFLESMFADLNDISEGSDEEVRAELIELGVDMEKAQKSFQATLETGRKFQKRRILEIAQKSRTAKQSRAAEFLEMIRRQGLAVQELIARISQLQPAMAHREFSEWSKEDLESQLADLLSLQGETREGE